MSMALTRRVVELEARVKKLESILEKIAEQGAKRRVKRQPSKPDSNLGS